MSDRALLVAGVALLVALGAVLFVRALDYELAELERRSTPAPYQPNEAQP